MFTVTSQLRIDSVLISPRQLCLAVIPTYFHLSFLITLSNTHYFSYHSSPSPSVQLPWSQGHDNDNSGFFIRQLAFAFPWVTKPWPYSCTQGCWCLLARWIWLWCWQCWQSTWRSFILWGLRPSALHSSEKLPTSQQPIFRYFFFQPSKC